MPKDAKAIANWYDALSTSYDDLYTEEQGKKHQQVIQTLKNRQFKTIVDVGCGTGKLLENVLPRTGLGLGIDLSKQMLIKAKQRTNDKSAQFVRAEASHLPLRSRIADCVISVSVSEHGPELTGQFQELSRIAEENAVLSLTVFSDNNPTLLVWLGENKMELVGPFSDKEQLWTRIQTPARTSSNLWL